jgi:hypothetical protein
MDLDCSRVSASFLQVCEDFKAHTGSRTFVPAPRGLESETTDSDDRFADVNGGEEASESATAEPSLFPNGVAVGPIIAAMPVEVPQVVPAPIPSSEPVLDPSGDQ